VLLLPSQRNLVSGVPTTLPQAEYGGISFDYLNLECPSIFHLFSSILNFGALPGTLFYLFCNFSVYSIDAIFILGDGLTRLVLRWEKSAPLHSCSWTFLG
jgi:hypothetical protein